MKVLYIFILIVLTFGTMMADEASGNKLDGVYTKKGIIFCLILRFVPPILLLREILKLF